MKVAGRVPSDPTVDDGRRLVRRAWWSLLLFAVSFVAAMVVGEGLASLGGSSQPSLADTAWWLVLLAFAAAIVVFASPLLLVARFSRAAERAGEPDARTPLLVSGIVVAGFVLLNLASGLLQLII